MKISRKWMNEEFVDLSAVSDGEYMERMTRFGLTVRSAEQSGDDTVVDFETGGGRPDRFSIIGLARESAAAFGAEMKHHEPAVRGCDSASIYEMLDAEVYADHLCSRCTLRMAVNVTVAPSPAWLRRRLDACGIPSVNNLTDIASYVMLEYGQPLDILDQRDIASGTVVIRESMEGEILTMPDGTCLSLPGGAPVVCDGFPVIGLAGIASGCGTGVREDTAAVVIMAVSPDAGAVDETTRALDLRTASSLRSEAGLDPMLTVPAVQRACELMELLNAGEVLDGTIDILNYVPQPRTMPLESEEISRRLGTALSPEQITGYLRQLEIPVEDGIIRIPSFRPDLADTADIAAEVGRILAAAR